MVETAHCIPATQICGTGDRDQADRLCCLGNPSPPPGSSQARLSSSPLLRNGVWRSAGVGGVGKLFSQMTRNYTRNAKCECLTTSMMSKAWKPRHQNTRNYFRFNLASNDYLLSETNTKIGELKARK